MTIDLLFMALYRDSLLLQICDALHGHRMQRGDKSLRQIVYGLAERLHRDLTHLGLCALLDNLVKPFRHLRIHSVLLEQLQRWSMHDQFDIDLVGPAFRVNVLVDESQGIFRHFRIFSIDVIEDLYLPLSFSRYRLILAQDGNANAAARRADEAQTPVCGSIVST